MAIEILKTGLTLGSKVYFKGDLIEEKDAHPRLLELANGALLAGEVVARIVGVVVEEQPEEPEPITETPEAAKPQNNFKGGRKKR